MNGERRPSRNRSRQWKGRAFLVGGSAIAVSLSLAVATPSAPPVTAAALPAESTATPQPRVDPTFRSDDLSASGDATKITLITGDSVYYADSGGAMPSIDVELDPESGTRDVSVLNGPDGVYVIPDRAQPLIDADVLDRELFDVQYLAENGYTDDEVDALPVIVTYERHRLTTRAALPSIETEPLELESINGAAIQVDKESADDFWTRISGIVPGTAPDTMALEKENAELKAGIDKIWLDGRVQASLDDSRPQIGVGQAWDHGFDGTGATVAVLDSGYDPGHPDLARQVTDSRSFVPGQDAHDRDGHGTHVASTIAGTGEASDGRYAGVAPGADLIVGKVLTGGFGLDSWVISGMEWAGENADVVNMSLGSFFPTDGTDPISLALNRISNDTGALFVVAAGNTGPSRSSISSPASADAALAVAAVDSDDQVADFSSRGPRVGDLGLKPEIAAPGSPVVAAWAAGTSPSPGVPVGEHYVAHQGTSMASPHVAGVAAMLVQQHPEWNAQQLKDALMSTSVDAGNDVYEQGAGRVDAARVTSQSLYATGKADFGRVAPDATTRARTITYTNTGDTNLNVDLTLDVSGLDGSPPGDALTLSDQSIVVPAHGQAAVDLTMAPSSSPPGEFTGHVRASSQAADVVTAVAYTIQRPIHELTVTAKGRFGDVPYSGLVILHDLNNAERYYATTGFDESGQAVFEVPEGDYGIHGSVRTRDRGRPNQLYSSDMYATTIMDVTDDRAVTIDARNAVDFEFNVISEQRALEPMQITRNIYRTDASGRMTGLAALGERQHTNAAFGAIPADEPQLGDIYMTTMTTLREPLIQASVPGSNSELFTVTPERTGRFEGTRELDLVDVGAGTAEDYAGLDVKGKLVMVESADNYVQDQAEIAAEHGAAALLATPQAPGVTSVAVASDNELPVIATSYEDSVELRTQLAQNPVSVALTGVRESTYTYTLRGAEDGAISTDLNYDFTRSDLAVVRNSFHSEAERLGSDALSTFEAWEGGALTYLLHLRQPTERTDYVVAGPGIQQRQSVSSKWGFNSARLSGANTEYRPGQVVRESWFKAPNHPSGYTELACIFCRSEAILQFAPRRYSDSDPTHYGSGRVGTSYTLYRDGERIDRPERLLVPEAATYRIEQVAEAIPDEDHFLANRSQTAWTFRSKAPSELEIDNCGDVLPGANACAALPVILLSYDLPLSIENTAPAKRPFHFDIRTDRPLSYTGQSEVEGIEVSLSFDDGATWERARTKQMQGAEGFRVLARHPKLADTNGYVSLRVEAWDSEGNRTSQTIERAYALSPEPTKEQR